MSPLDKSENGSKIVQEDFQAQRYTAEDLNAIIERLRDPEAGCPWDKVQTHQSIRMNFLEEAYEAVDALDLDDAHLLCEELGDVLMQVVFHARIEAERGRFDWDDVCDGVCRKLISRHPHIFGGEDASDGIKDWDAIKNMEKGRQDAARDMMDVPRAMPSLMRAAKLQKRAEKHGLPFCADEQTAADAMQALRRAADTEAAEAAAGELLFAAAALARRAGVDPEQALQRRNDRFLADAARQSLSSGTG